MSALLRVLYGALALVALWVHSPVASAQEVARRAMDVRFADGVPRVSGEASSLVDAEMRRRLQSGLPQTLLTRVYAYRGSSGTPLAMAVRSCRITWDLWDLQFRVQHESASGESSSRARTLQEVFDLCVDLNALPVGDRDDWQAHAGRRAWFAVLIELNPMSPETVRRVRRWLAQPGGVGPADGAFFGTFVSLFVNRQISQAERTIRFRSTTEVRCP